MINPCKGLEYPFQLSDTGAAMFIIVAFTTEYSPVCVCVCVRACVPACLPACVRVCVWVFVNDNTKRNQSRNMILEYIVVYERSSRHRTTSMLNNVGSRSRPLFAFKSFPNLPQYKLSGPIDLTQFWYRIG